MCRLKAEKFDQHPIFDQFLSFVDLEKHPKWNKAWKEQNQEVFEEVLFDLGADVTQGWSISVCLHRPRTSNAAEYGPMVRFKERTDKGWESYRDVSDIVRDTESSVARYGMKLSLGDGNCLNDLMVEKLKVSVKVFEDKEGK